MKRINFLMICILISVQTFAQDKWADIWCDTWNVLYHGWYGPSDEPYMPLTRIFQLGQDTIINEMTYQTLSRYFSLDPQKAKSYVAALRFTDDKKVFIHYDNTEYLLYDFNVQIGDTLQIFGGIDYYKDSKTLPHIITAIDTLEDGRLRIKSDAVVIMYPGEEWSYESKYHKTWIEGIGSLNGIVQNSATSRIGAGTSQLLCGYYNDECTYTTDDPYYTPYGCVYNDPILSAEEDIKSPATSAQKILRDGQLFIIYEDKTYNIMGMTVDN